MKLKLITLRFDSAREGFDDRPVRQFLEDKRLVSIDKRANLRLEKLRFLVRLSHRQKLISTGSYEDAARRFDTAGRMVGGWLRQQTAGRG